MDIKEFYVQDRRATAITSMCLVGDEVYCGLTGSSYALAKFNIKTEKFELCTEVFPWLRNKSYCTKIHNSMGVLSDKEILFGEGNHFTWDGLPVYSQYLKSELPEIMLKRKREQGYEDITYSDFCLDSLADWDRERDDPGGKIVKYNVETNSIEVIADLPKYCYSQAMIVDPVNQMAYGDTIPDNHFFAVDCKTNTIKDYGRISEYGHHNLVVSPKGICYGGWMDYYNHTLKLLKFDPKVGRLEYTDTVILRDVGTKIAGNQGIDQWLVTRDGEIYVGMVANSLIFRFHEDTEEFELIGQAAKGGRVATMDEDENGIIWLGAGYPHMHLVRFDKKATGKDRFYDCGVVGKSEYRCYFHSSCYKDGKLYLGETDGFTPSLHVIDLKTV